MSSVTPRNQGFSIGAIEDGMPACSSRRFTSATCSSVRPSRPLPEKSTPFLVTKAIISACEAALALSDAGAKVTVSYRGKGFNRAAPKNKQAIESYAAGGRIKVKLGSQVLMFDAESVTLTPCASAVCLSR